jgi:ribosomal protein S18 acetylase RimI-like enzyme
LSAAVRARLLELADRDAALRFLSRDSISNLSLLDLASQLGRSPAPGEARGEIVAAWRGEEIVGMAGLHPTVILDAHADKQAVEVFLPYLERLKVGLVKSLVPAVDELWGQLTRRRSRRVIVDRIESAYALYERDAKPAGSTAGGLARRAIDSDLDDLVIAARESLREEERPDPFLGDVEGFRRWVRGRVGRARVVECAGRVAMVGYADVQRPEGWLLQGIYTWPGFRKRGLASFGVSKLCREAFAAGSDHVQLAVVDGNAAAERLYRGLGFKPFAKLRTILFT